MAIEYLKRATHTAASAEEDVRNQTAGLLARIESGGEAVAKECACELDGWDQEIVVRPELLEKAEQSLPARLKEDIQLSHANVRRFAEAQLRTLTDMQIEVVPGLTAGQKQIPVQTAGCYVPGGRYSHIASAVMTVTTAKVAGVENIIACSPPRPGLGIPPAILYSLALCGADRVLNLGGVQGIATLAFGLFGGPAADILVGPGNQYVAEAKRLLFGRVGIDMLAGPTETMVIAGTSADPEIVAWDLVGQAEHGYNSPVWLVSLGRSLAERVIAIAPDLLESLPRVNRESARSAWQDFGEVIVVDTRQEAVQVSDAKAPEHLQVHCDDPHWWLAHLRNYGSLFLGEETTVAFGDKVSGPNHVLPTKAAARYTGGLSVGKFLKTVTWQRMDRAATRAIAGPTARISRLEGMEGHARTADVRLAKWFPNEEFELHVQPDSDKDQ